jgi:hypothetical protein
MIGEKGDNLFVVEFGSKVDLDRVLAGTPWITGKHAIILKEYDEKLKPSEICFDRMDIWVRVLNLPLGWMNEHRGTRVMRLLGEVKAMDVDADGKASGAYLRARVSIELDKPIKRGVLLRMPKAGEPEWFDAQYEKLPFLCFSCGILGHGGLVCDKPAQRNAQGKLPYEREPPLRAPDDRRKKLQSLAEAAAESYGSGFSSSGRPTQSGSGKSGDLRTEENTGRDDNLHGGTKDWHMEEGEVTSPLKNKDHTSKGKKSTGADIGRQLFQDDGMGDRKSVRKRKPRRSGGSSQTPDLNMPLTDAASLVPVGLVSARVGQLVGDLGGTDGEETQEEMLKK